MEIPSFLMGSIRSGLFRKRLVYHRSMDRVLKKIPAIHYPLDPI